MIQLDMFTGAECTGDTAGAAVRSHHIGHSLYILAAASPCWRRHLPIKGDRSQERGTSIVFYFVSLILNI